jgi:colanic acid biosynthesis glycosyl transferase WcaI
MHVVFFNRSFYPDTTATGQLLTELCEGLVREHGCSVSVVAGVPLSANGHGRNGERAGVLVGRERYHEIDVFRARGTRFSKRHVAGRFSNYVSYFLSACYAGLCLKRPDVIVALTDPPVIGLAGYLASRRFRIPFVMSFQDVFPEAGRLLEDFRSNTVDGVLQAVNCFLIRKAARSVGLSEGMRRRLIEGKGAFPESTVVIPSWADCRAFASVSKENAFSDANGLAGKFVVMHSGNLGLSQGLEIMVDAAAQLRTLTDIEFVLIGDGVKKVPLEERARSLGLQNIQFLPYQPKERLKDSYGSADVFVVSVKSGMEGYTVPSKLYGILAAGRPYVAAVEDHGEVAALTRRFECGLLARPGSAADLADRILTLYRDRSLAARLGSNARRAALEFDRPVQTRAYHELLACVASVHAPARPGKRAFDIATSGAGLLLSLPLWGVIGLCIKLEDGGPVFYGQARVGKAGRRFRSWKFRSMHPDSDARYGPCQAGERDPRVTRIGRLLRATAMDELPQLWNIFRGEMSFVGPRPLMPTEVEVRGDGGVVSIEEIPGYRERHLVTPGLTGLAQVYAPRDLPRRHKFRLDRLYARRQTFWLDLKLIGLSFWITFCGNWERRGKKF